MTKTVHPVLKKVGAVLLTVLVLVLMAVPAFAVTLPDAPTGYVYDGANVLSSSTESYIERTGSALAEACGAEVVVATVDFTDGEDIADYAYDLFNKWGIGDKKENNGLLILLSIGAEDYYAEPGTGLTDVFTGGVLDAMLYDYLEDDFAAKEYDSGVKKVYARAVEILEDHYNVSYSAGTTNNANANNSTSGGILYGFQRFFSRMGRFVFIVLFVILIIALSIRRPRRYYRRGWGAPPPPPPKAPALFDAPIDPSLLSKIAGLMQRGSIDQDQMQLLKALRPYLSGQKLQKLERAMHAARMAGIASDVIGAQGHNPFTGG